MGRRKYLNMLALGRSPYELPEPVSDILRSSSGLLPDQGGLQGRSYVQEYDSKGRPTNADSKAREKRLRRAKNDILSIMGIVINSRNADADASNTLRRKRESLLNENEAGLAMSIVSDIVFVLAGWRIRTYDQRFQASHAYDHLSFSDSLRAQEKDLGYFKFAFAGLPTWLLCNAVKAAYLSLREALFPKFSIDYHNFIQKPLLTTSSQLVKSALLMGTHVFVELYTEQLRAFAVLQTVGVITNNSLPSLSLLSPFNLSAVVPFPAFPMSLNYANLARFICELKDCPLVIGLLANCGQRFLKTQLHPIIWDLLPRPHNADHLSTEVAEEMGLSELGMIKPKASVLSTLVVKTQGFLKDLRKSSQLSWNAGLLWIGWQHASPQVNYGETVNYSDAAGNIQFGTDNTGNAAAEEQVPPVGENMPRIQGSSSAHSSWRPTVLDDTQLPQERWTLPTEPHDIVASTSLQDQALEQSLTEGRSFFESNDVVNQSYDRTQTPGESSPVSSHSDYCSAYQDTPTVYHHVSVLSTGPSESMSIFLTSMISSILLRPLNTYWIRHTIQSYLLSNVGVTSGITAQAYQLRPVNAWFGGGSLSSRLSYVSRSFLIFGLHSVLNVAVWKLFTYGTTLLGQERFKWGSL